MGNNNKVVLQWAKKTQAGCEHLTWVPLEDYTTTAKAAHCTHKDNETDKCVYKRCPKLPKQDIQNF